MQDPTLQDPGPVVPQVPESPPESGLENIAFLRDFFEKMDAQDPSYRLVIAGAFAGAFFLLLLVTRFVVYRRVKRLKDAPEGKVRALRWQAQELISSEDMRTLWLGIIRGVGMVISVCCVVGMAIGLLALSKWSQNVAGRILSIILGALEFLWDGFVGYLPDLITILVIVFLARYLVKIIGLIFDGIATRRIRLRNFYPEWAHTSFGIIRICIYAMTAVIIFPYLPGSSSPAFQGISIFVGVLVSLGSTTAVANVVAGVVLTFTRAMQVDDQVEVAGVRGMVAERTMFVTRIKTLKNVVVSVPNAMVLNNNIINYSKSMGQRGVVVHTSITIGYDVPWQKVNGLLIAAAVATEGIADDPGPFVLQTSLEDDYVTYEINGWTRDPEHLPRVYSDLHANILDEFHGHEVEITSPKYRSMRDGNQSTVSEVLARGGAESEAES